MTFIQRVWDYRLYEMQQRLSFTSTPSSSSSTPARITSYTTHTYTHHLINHTAGEQGGVIAGPNAHSQRTAPPPASSTASSPPCSATKRCPSTGLHVTNGNRGGVHGGFQEQRPWCGGTVRARSCREPAGGGLGLGVVKAAERGEWKPQRTGRERARPRPGVCISRADLGFCRTRDKWIKKAAVAPAVRAWRPCAREARGGRVRVFLGARCAAWRKEALPKKIDKVANPEIMLSTNLRNH
jgi:hypothetical protein